MTINNILRSSSSFPRTILFMSTLIAILAVPLGLAWAQEVTQVTPVAPVAPEASVVGASGTSSIFQMMLSAGFVVQLVLFCLIMASVSTWAVIIAKAKSYWDASRQNAQFEQVFWSSGSLSAAHAQTKVLGASPLASLFRLAYGELGKVMRLGGEGGPPQQVVENIRRSLARGEAAEITRLGRALTLLATVGSTAPYVGLFGTVWGIMYSFMSIGATGSANLATVAPGIAEALVATATGLFAAIPAVAFNNHFLRRLQVFEAEMDSFCQDFLNLVERDLIRRKSNGPVVEAVRPAATAMVQER